MELASFRTYTTLAEAEALQEILKHQKIDSIIIDNSPAAGAAIGGQQPREYEVKLKPEDFGDANAWLKKQAKEEMGELPEGYYLIDFTNDELIDVLAHRYEWSEFDYLHARRLLEERGVDVDEQQLQEINVNRLHELAKPEKDQGFWIIVGYIFALLGGVLGIITGYVLVYSTKTLPTGISVPTYSPKDRKYGRYILILSVIVFTAAVLYQLSLMMKE